MQTDFGVLSIVPPVLVIVLALITKKILLSLIIGTWVGVTMINGWNPLVAFPNMVSDFITPAIANEGNAAMLILVTIAGGFVALLKTSGAAQSLGAAATRKIKTRKAAQTATWFAAFGLIYTEPNFTLGVIMRPITEKLGVARVKLAYITDSMGCNLASMSPICSYGPFIVGLIAAQTAALGISDEPWSLFFRYIPFNFYGIFAILTVLYVISAGLDVGAMYHAERRAITTGDLIGPNDRPIVVENPDDFAIPPGARLSIKNFAVPIGSLFLAVFTVILWSGDVAGSGIVQAFKDANITLAIICGMLMGAVAAAITGWRSGVFSLDNALDKWTKGSVNMLEVNLVLILAWALGNVIGVMDVKGFLAGLISSSGAPPFLVPAFVFLTGAFMGFSTGSSWGTFAILMPIAVPVAHQFGLPIEMAIAAVIGGGLFGDHCSPISDNTILASTAAACDHVEHVKTQLPYAITIAIAAFFGFIVSGLTRTLVPGMLLAALVVGIGIYVLHRIARHQHANATGVS